jgi:hypothetical protein
MQNSTINPICCHCGQSIGEMPLDIYMMAVEYRGPFLLCPICRIHKCDCCGWVIPAQIMTPVYSNDHFIGNACESCKDWVLTDNPAKEDFPHFRTEEKPGSPLPPLGKVLSEFARRKY